MRCQMRTSVSSCDVLFGRTKQAINHPGTVSYHAMVQAFVPEYKRNLPQPAKIAIMNEIIDRVKSRGGRFLRLSEGGDWREISDADARSTISQTLRDARAVSAAAILQQYDRISVIRKRSAAQIAEHMETRRNMAPCSIPSDYGVIKEGKQGCRETVEKPPRGHGSKAIVSLLTKQHADQQTAELPVANQEWRSPYDVSYSGEHRWFFDMKGASVSCDPDAFYGDAARKKRLASDRRLRPVAPIATASCRPDIASSNKQNEGDFSQPANASQNFKVAIEKVRHDIISDDESNFDCMVESVFREVDDDATS